MFKLRPRVASSVKAVSNTDMCYERILDAFTSTSFKYKNQEVLTWRHFSLVLLYPSLFVFLDVTRDKPSIKLLVHQLRELLPRLFFLEREKHPNPRFDISASRNISDAAIHHCSVRVLQSPFCWVNWEENPGGAHNKDHSSSKLGLFPAQHRSAKAILAKLFGSCPAQKAESFIQWNDFVL